jgi:hypothetical protein
VPNQPVLPVSCLLFPVSSFRFALFAQFAAISFSADSNLLQNHRRRLAADGRART